MKDPKDYQEPDFASTWGFAGEWLASAVDGSTAENASTDMAGMNQHEREAVPGT